MFGTKDSRQALQWALEEAQAHQRPLLAVSTWTTPPVPTDPPFGSFPWGASVDAGPATRTMVEAVVDEVAADYPDVHGGFVGMLLGSVSQHVLAHSRCTVVVVR